MEKHTGKDKYKVKTTKYSIRLEDAKVSLLKETYGVDSITELIDRLIDERIRGILPEPKKIKSPILRIGGKSFIADKLVELMPEHKVYCEVFAGASHLLFSKDPSVSKLEIINDKENNIVNLFEVIRDNPMELRAELLKMPCSRQYYNSLKKSLSEPPRDKVQRAAIYFYLVRNSYFGSISSGWRATNKNNTPKTIQRIADELYWISERLKKTIIESSDWRYILTKYGRDSNSFLFVDQPYIGIKGKKTGLYEIPFTVSDARELAKRLNELPAKIMVTHYPNKLIEKYYEGWRRVEIQTFKAAGKVIENEIVDASGNIIKTRNKPRATEIVFMNY